MGSFSGRGTHSSGYGIDDWKEDLLGSDYQNLTVPLGSDPDGETDVFATIVRYFPEGTDLTEFHQRPALLWVHGMTDYFFHTEFAEFFHSHGFAVYAVDLRKCGRSHRPGQLWHYVSELSFYFPDLNAAGEIITAHHPTFIPVAHSTGGLIVPLWMQHLRVTDPDSHARISALVLNSPWLDMMHRPLLVKIARPVINWLGRKHPLRALPRDGLATYGKSIHKSHKGEWEFDNMMKPVEGHRKNFAWLRTVMAGHLAIHRDEVNVSVDVLMLCSDKSWFKREYTPEVDSSDAVLDVELMKKWAPHLSRPSSRVSVQPVVGARHDVFLSVKPVRDQAMSDMLSWLQSH